MTRKIAALLLLALAAAAVPGGAQAARRSPKEALRQALRAGTAAEAPLASPRGKPMPEPIAVAQDALAKALKRGELSEADYALQRALSAFNLSKVRDRFGHVARPDSHAVTILLRDLRARTDRLSAEEQELAERLLARPDDSNAEPFPDSPKYTTPSQSRCDEKLCVHWVTSTAHAPPMSDVSPSNGVPDWVETNLTIFDQAWDSMAAMGYRPPKADTSSPNNGQSGKFDVYLADIGGDSIYGYCTTDDPNANPSSGYQFWDVSAFCVVDNDFSTSQFPNNTSLNNLRVTVFHEFFHAVQFGYDFLEDTWLQEGTATWMEDELADDVNDNYQYLGSSHLAQPYVPLDVGQSPYHYGAFVWWSFLEEFSAESGPDPSIIRGVWELADGSSTGPDQHSAQATQSALAARGLSLRSMFSAFAIANYLPDLFYEEGADWLAAVGGYLPPDASVAITKSASRRTGTCRMDHLTQCYVAFSPGRGVARSAKLKLTLDLPPRKRGSEARALVFQSGTVSLRAFTLTSTGDGVLKLPFGKGSVAEVTLVLSNASARFACFQGSPFSCQGAPRDDGLGFKFTATLLQ